MFVVLFLSSAFGGSEFLFGAVLAAPSVPQGCLGGPVGVFLRAVRGAQIGPPYCRDSLFLGSLWRPFGVLGGVFHAFFRLFWFISLIISTKGPVRLNRKRLLGSVARNLRVLRGFGWGPCVAGRPGRGPGGCSWGLLVAPGGLWVGKHNQNTCRKPLPRQACVHKPS